MKSEAAPATQSLYGTPTHALSICARTEISCRLERSASSAWQLWHGACRKRACLLVLCFAPLLLRKASPRIARSQQTALNFSTLYGASVIARHLVLTPDIAPLLADVRSALPEADEQKSADVKFRILMEAPPDAQEVSWFHRALLPVATAIS